MAKGESGRVVIEISPELKRHLYSLLAMESRTLKDWFIKAATDYVSGQEESDPVVTGSAAPGGQKK